MKKIILALMFVCVFVLDTFAQNTSDTMLNLRNYSSFFLNSNGTSIQRAYTRAASSEDLERLRPLGGELDSIDTPLEIALLSNTTGVIDVRPVEANRMLGNARQADLKLGAAVYQEMQILRFLGDTAALARHEAVLHFITERGNATQAQIQAFFSNGIRGLVSDLVDEQRVRLNNEGAAINVSTSVLSNIKSALTEFMLAPNDTTYRNLLRTSLQNAGDGQLILGYTMGQINNEIANALADNRIITSSSN